MGCSSENVRAKTEFNINASDVKIKQQTAQLSRAVKKRAQLINILIPKRKSN